MAIDYTNLVKKLNPEYEVGGDPGLRLRVGTVTTLASDGSVDLTMADGAVVPDVPVLGGAFFAVGTVVQVLSYRGSMLVLGGSGAVSSQPVELVSVSAGNGTTTSVTFTNTLIVTPPVVATFGVAFIAPPSGKVAVFARSLGGHSVAASYVHMDFEIKTGSVIGAGANFRAPNDLTTAVLQSAVAGNQGHLSVSGLVTGLTPGADYHADMVYKLTGAGTGTYNRRQIMVLPQ